MTIHAHDYPVCEFDGDRGSLITPADFLEKTLPERCVITFFRKELDELAAEKQLPVIGQLHSEVVDLPIYRYSDDICVTMPFCAAPGAASTLEELYAMGCQRFLVCGGAGSLREGSRLGEIILPTAAVRDEGTSYHYLPPAREVACHPGAAEAVMAGLEQLSIPYTTGKTWTTDAMYRETPGMIRRRREEGCITVEMEAAAFFAVSRYYDIPLAQLLYAGDDVSGKEWDTRNWNSQESLRANLLRISLKLVETL